MDIGQSLEAAFVDARGVLKQNGIGRHGACTFNPAGRSFFIATTTRAARCSAQRQKT
jgi:hypothetical protein